MKITAQEENGLRILLRIAQSQKSEGLTIAEISAAEGLSNHNVAKICRMLRLNGFIKSTRGHAGGYMLATPANELRLVNVIETLGGRLYDADFCDSHAGVKDCCNNAVDCTVRSLWQILQNTIDGVLKHMTLNDLIHHQPAQPPQQIRPVSALVRS